MTEATLERSNNKQVTLKDLAAHLDLGITTVSDILLRGKTNYKAQTVERVQAAARALNYQPNALAQGIRSGKTQTIGLLVTMNILDPFFAELVNRLESRFEENGLMILLSISDNDLERDKRVLRFFESRRVDGIVVGPIYYRDSVIPLFEHYASRLPMVMFLAGENAPCDTVDGTANPTGMAPHLAAREFLRLGHRKIGYLMCPVGARLDKGFHPKRSFYSALKREDVYNEKWVWEAPLPLADEAYRKMKEILSTHSREDLPTAIYCHNDHCAVGAMAALREAGLRVPDDISLIGTDNIVTSAFTDPPLTTVDLRPSDLADQAFRLMTDRLANPRAPKRHIEVKPRFVERDSARSLGKKS